MNDTMTSDDAVKDFAMFLEDIILKRPLTYEEARAIKIKVEYWWKTAEEGILGRDTCRLEDENTASHAPSIC